MAKINRQVVVSLLADVSGFKSGLQDARKEVTNLEGKFAGVAKAGAAVAAAGIGIAAGIGKGIASSISAFAQFEDKLNESQAIMGDLSDRMKQDMSAAALEVSKTTRFSAEQAAESYFFLASAGLSAEQSIAALPQVAAFAQAGMFDMALATDLATDAQSALGLTVPDAAQNLENLTHVTDVLVKSNTLANTSVQQVSEALTNKLGAALRAANIPMEEGVAVLAAYADQGLKGAAAGEGLGIALRDLKRAASENATQFRAAGIQVFNSEGNFRNLADIVEDVEGAFGDLSVQEQTYLAENLGFQDRSFKNIQLLFGTSDAIRRYESELRKAGGTTQEIADNQLQSLSAQMDLLKSNIDATKIEVGEGLAPAFKDVIPQLQILVSVFGDVAVAMGPTLAKAAEFAIRALEGVAETGLRLMSLFGNEVAGTQADLIEVMSAYRRGVIDTINPTTDLANIMVGLEQRAALTEENFLAAADAVGANAAEQLRALEVMREWLITNGVQTKGVDAWIASLEAASEEQQEVARWQSRLAGTSSDLGGDLEDLGGAADDAGGELGELGEEAYTLAQRLERAADAQESLADVLKKAADPVFAAVKSYQEYRNTLKDIDEDGKRTAEEQLKLAEAILDTQTALDGLSGDSLEEAVTSIATALDTSTDAVIDLLEELGVLDGKQVRALIEIGLTGPGANLVDDRQAASAGDLSDKIRLAGGRAAGGPVEKDAAYVVGESGPEIFVPATSGTIIPNGGATRNVQINFNNTTLASDPLRATRAALAVEGLDGAF